MKTSTPIVRNELMHELLHITIPNVAIEAILNGFDGSHERLIAKALKNMWNNGSARVLGLFDYLEISKDNVSDKQFSEAAYMITASTIPSEHTADIGID